MTYRSPLSASFLASLLCLSALAGCGESSSSGAAPTPASASENPDGPDVAAAEEAVHLPDHGEAPDPATDPLGAQLYAMGLERVRRFEALERFSGTLGAGEVMSHDVALDGTYCYAVLAVGAETIENLDLSALDPAGRAFQHDTELDHVATLGLSRRLCPDGGALVRLRVRAFRGAGDYTLQLFRHRVL